MKEINPIQKDTVKISAERQVEKKRVLVGSQRLYPNQRCFEINKNTGDIKEADYKHFATFGGGYKRQVDIREDCAYIIAINKANALKKYHNQK